MGRFTNELTTTIPTLGAPHEHATCPREMCPWWAPSNAMSAKRGKRSPDSTAVRRYYSGHLAALDTSFELRAVFGIPPVASMVPRLHSRSSPSFVAVVDVRRSADECVVGARRIRAVAGRPYSVTGVGRDGPPRVERRDRRGISRLPPDLSSRTRSSRPSACRPYRGQAPRADRPDPER